MRFKIEYALEPRIGAVFAQQLDAGDFKLHEGATLGGIPIHPSFNMPRALYCDGNPRLNVFAFYPISKNPMWIVSPSGPSSIYYRMETT